MLILAGSRALSLSVPNTLAIIALITVGVFSYRQVIAAYPEVGGPIWWRATTWAATWAGDQFAGALAVTP